MWNSIIKIYIDSYAKAITTDQPANTQANTTQPAVGASILIAVDEPSVERFNTIFPVYMGNI